MSTEIRFQPRDVQLLSELGEVGILDIDTLRSRFFPLDKSGKACPKRMFLYEKNKLVLKHEIKVTNKEESRKYIVFRVTEKGADQVERLTGRRPRRAGGSKEPDSKTLAHRLGYIRTRLAFDDGCNLLGRPELDWIMEWDAVPDAPRRAGLSRRIVLCDTFTQSDHVDRSWPDLAFRFPMPEHAWDLLAYIEYDRSTMENDDMLDKLDGYSQLMHTGVYLRHWQEPINQHLVRVLFVCKSPQRIENLMKLYAKHDLAEPLRFATADSLTAAAVFTSPIWHKIGGQGPFPIIRSSDPVP
jgi:hypothetical protein